MSTFAFGAAAAALPSENPEGGDDDPPKDEKDIKIARLEKKLSLMKLKNQELKVENHEIKRELEQSKDLLGSIQAPTVFNQLQVKYNVLISSVSF